MTRVLILEDEPELANLLDAGLAAHGYATQVCRDEEAALRLVDCAFDLFILDLGMPDVDGVEFLRRLRRRGEDPVLVILRPGVRARVQPEDGEESVVLETAGIALHGRTHRARVGGRTVELTEREFVLLESFMRNPGQILSKEQPFEQVWGPGYEPGSRLVQVYVGYLRKARPRLDRNRTRHGLQAQGLR
jgi:DNA-binding response OmpR family regulator